VITGPYRKSSTRSRSREIQREGIRNRWETSSSVPNTFAITRRISPTSSSLPSIPTQRQYPLQRTLVTAADEYHPHRGHLSVLDLDLESNLTFLVFRFCFSMKGYELKLCSRDFAFFERCEISRVCCYDHVDGLVFQ